jgi:hypothetical protein
MQHVCGVERACVHLMLRVCNRHYCSAHVHACPTVVKDMLWIMIALGFVLSAALSLKIFQQSSTISSEVLEHSQQCISIWIPNEYNCHTERCQSAITIIIQCCHSRARCALACEQQLRTRLVTEQCGEHLLAGRKIPCHHWEALS